MTDIRWHRVYLEEGHPVYGREAKLPGKGVWVATLDRQDGGQTTREVIAVDGETVSEMVCYCGYDRHQVIVKAAALLPARKTGRVVGRATSGGGK